MTPQITLYAADGACSMVPHMLLRELDVPCKRVVMGFGPDGLQAKDGSVSGKEYLKINTNSQVPTLVIDGYIITEMPAILHYISSLAPERHLFGSRPMDPFRVEEWIAWLSGTVHSAGFGALWRPSRYVEDEDLHEKISEKAKNKILDCFRRIEERVEGDFAVGDAFTVVDFNLHMFWRWAQQRVGIDMYQYPRFTNIVRKVEALESVKAVTKEEDQKLNFE